MLLAMLAAQLYSQYVPFYYQHWTNMHWSGITLVAIWFVSTVGFHMTNKFGEGVDSRKQQ